MTRPVWNAEISDAERQVAEVGGFFLEVHRQYGSTRWGWHVWSGEGSPGYVSIWAWQRKGSRRLRWLAVRDALREVARLRGGRV